MKYLKLLRVKHYLKNLLIFLPLIFSEKLFNKTLLKTNIIGFIAFSLVASIIYIINDIRDIEKDKKHPTKKKRPLASGSISIKSAIIIIIILTLASSLLLYFNKLLFNPSTLFLLAYLLLNLAYSFGFKNIPLVDITALAFGFVLRVIYGGLLLNIEISNWLFLTILSASYYMALGKRTNELKNIKNGKTREVLKFYPKDFLERMMYVFLTLTIVFYSLWATIGVNNEFLKYSIIFIIIIFMEYSINIENNTSGDPIEVILEDKTLILLTIFYAIYCYVLLYVL